MTLWWPVLQARLVALCPTIAPNFVPFDGIPAGLEEKGATKTLSVGASKDDGPGEFEITDDPVDTFLQETGTVVLEVITWGGDRDVPTKRAEAFAVVEALQEQIRTDPRLGVLPEAGSAGVSVTPVNLTTSVRLVVSVTYLVRS